jgi:hypothetical protein
VCVFVCVCVCVCVCLCVCVSDITHTHAGIADLGPWDLGANTLATL